MTVKPHEKNLRSQQERVLCDDGSYTLYSKEFEEPYHSTKDGALHESLEKHVKPALFLKEDQIVLTILDICFGLGYNSFATLSYIKEKNLDMKIHILSAEFDEDLVHSLDNFEYPAYFDEIRHIIKAVSEDLYYEDEQFKIEILIGDAREIIGGLTPNNKIDIVYQDPFSPTHNPLLWTREWFTDIRELCRDDAILTTYSTAAAVRLGLYENGFHIFIHRAEKIRFSTIASLQMLSDIEYVDMELKRGRNPDAQSMKDKDYLL
ncbi:MAG: hypothetical protein HF962_08450 [Sulfurovum sp.]|nr:hypothetical protein [Sulfurovum sp.]